jgi:hypothetical protein
LFLVENAPYYLDYNGQSTTWTEQQTALNVADIQSSSTGYDQRIKLNELGQSSSLLTTAKPDDLLQQPQTVACVEEHPNRYYPLSSSFFPPNEQQFSQLEVVSANNNFTFLSEVTQTLLGNHCQ